MRPKLILLDLDDTLMAFDTVSEAAWEKAVDIFINDNKLDVSKIVLLDKIHRTRKWYWNDPERHRIGRKNPEKARREVVKYVFLNYIKIDKKSADKFADNYSQIHEEMWHLFDGVEETLQKIRNNNIKLGIVTNGTSIGQRSKMIRFNIDKYFDYFFIEGEVGYGKPDIKIFECVLRETKIKSNHIIMAGDNLAWDIEPPQKLGIYTVWVNAKGVAHENTNIKPDKIIQKIPDLMDFTGDTG
jgi:putative hydrolase of the HAD superfamily